MTKSQALAEFAELPEAPSVAVVRVQPGDVIVLEFPGIVSDQSVENIHRRLTELWPDNKIAVIGDGGTFKVMRG